LVFLILPRPLCDLCSLQIDLLHLTTETDVEVLINPIVFEEPLISDSRNDEGGYTSDAISCPCFQEIEGRNSTTFLVLLPMDMLLPATGSCPIALCVQYRTRGVTCQLGSLLICWSVNLICWSVNLLVSVNLYMSVYCMTSITPQVCAKSSQGDRVCYLRAMENSPRKALK
jgi:hypothetical protein